MSGNYALGVQVILHMVVEPPAGWQNSQDSC